MASKLRPILSRADWKRGIGFLSLALGIGWLRGEDPAAWTVAANGAAVGGSQGSASETFSALIRAPLTAGPSGWRAVGGVAVENDAFDGTQAAGTPENLRSIAATLGLEFWQDGEAVASVRMSPGEYFQDRPTSGDWDVPIEAWSGVPVPGAPTLSGAIGIEAARFYHHPIPIVGAVWTPNARVRLEAVYPEPALVITASREFEARIGGELIGGGYLARSLLGPTPVEYYAYRLGGTLQWKQGPCSFSAAAGDEVEREFDFFRQGRRIRRGGRAYAELGLSWRR